MFVEDNTFYLSKRVEFSAAHRLHREDFSKEKNEEVFGQCANPYGHGHNYALEITIKGTPHKDTGLVMHAAELKRLLDECIVLPLDHRHLNEDVPFLKGILPTLENLASVFWDRIHKILVEKEVILYKLRLSSTERTWVEYRGPRRERRET